MLINLRK